LRPLAVAAAARVARFGRNGRYRSCTCGPQPRHTSTLEWVHCEQALWLNGT
jgi:hypothetical protein